MAKLKNMMGMEDDEEMMSDEMPAEEEAVTDEAAAAGEQTANVDEVPGAEELSPQEREQLQRVAVAAQAVLASPKHNRELVQTALQGDSGIAQVVVTIVALIQERQEMPRDFIAVAAMAVLLVVVDFLHKINKLKVDEQTYARLSGKVLVAVGRQFGATERDFNDLAQQAPSEQRKSMNLERAKGGPLGRMMKGMK